MTGPVRLLDGRIDPYLREVLRSAELDEPDHAAFERAFTSFAAGAGATTLLVAAKGTAASGAGSVLSGGKVAAGSAAVGKTSLAVLLKWVGLGALAGAVTTGTIAYVRTADEPPTRERAPMDRDSPSAQRHPLTRPDPDPIMRDTVTAGERVQPAQLEPTTPNSVKHRTEPVVPIAPNVASPVTAEPGPSPLLTEVVELDHARAALGRGDYAGALRALDEYAVVTRTHVLDREATIVRIDTLVASGQRARAVELARSYVARYPTDSHAKRLRDLVEGQP